VEDLAYSLSSRKVGSRTHIGEKGGSRRPSPTTDDFLNSPPTALVSLTQTALNFGVTALFYRLVTIIH
jgi:hypothetical protein